MADAAPGRHQVELAGPHDRVVPGGVAVLDLAGEQPADRLQPGVRVRRHDHPARGVDLVGTVVVHEAPGSDQRALPLRESTPHRHRTQAAQRARHAGSGPPWHPACRRTPRRLRVPVRWRERSDARAASTGSWGRASSQEGSAAATAAEAGRAVAARRDSEDDATRRRARTNRHAGRRSACPTAGTSALTATGTRLARRPPPWGRPPPLPPRRRPSAATATASCRTGPDARPAARRRRARAHRGRAARSIAWSGPEIRVVVGLDAGGTGQGADVADLLVGHQRDDGAGGAGARRAARAVQVGLVLGRRVGVDHEGDVVDVDAARGDVGGDQRGRLAGLERLHVAGAGVLGEVAVQLDRRVRRGRSAGGPAPWRRAWCG